MRIFKSYKDVIWINYDTFWTAKDLTYISRDYRLQEEVN